jgi:hypothetical protein
MDLQTMRVSEKVTERSKKVTIRSVMHPDWILHLFLNARDIRLLFKKANIMSMKIRPATPALQSTADNK